MKVILKREVDNLGLPGDVVDVADGYGRNFLIPRGMAILATRGAMKDAEAILRSRKAAEAKTLDSAEAMREVLEQRTLRITARVDDRGALYGSVSTVDIERVLRERGHDIPRKRIELKGTIKEIGTYEIPVRVHPQVTATVTVEVVDVEGKVGVGGIVEEEPPPLLVPGADAAGAEDAFVEQAIEAAEAYEAEHAPAADEGEDAADATEKAAADDAADESDDATPAS